MKGCAKFNVVGNKFGNKFKSTQYEGQCLEYFFGRNPHWGLWNCRYVHAQTLPSKGLQWCVESNCLEEVPATTPSFEKYFKIITRGQCSDHPDLRSATRTECGTWGASWHLNKEFQGVDLKGKKGKRRAAGCLWSKDGKLRYNRMSKSKKQCGSLGRSCICTRKQHAAR